LLAGDDDEFGDSVEASGDVLATGSCCEDRIYQMTIKDNWR